MSSSLGIGMSKPVRAAIDAIPGDAWTRIDYPWAIPDPETGEPIAQAEVAETAYPAFTSKPKQDRVAARLIVRRVPERNKDKLQGELFPVHRYRAILTDPGLPLLRAEAQHRGHAVIEQVFADLKASAPAHLPSGRFSANAAWLVCAAIASNLTRAMGALAGGALSRAETATVRARIITIPARIARSARRITLHLPKGWLWATPWLTAWRHALAPEIADRSRATRPTAPDQEGQSKPKPSRPPPAGSSRPSTGRRSRQALDVILASGHQPIGGIGLSRPTAPRLPLCCLPASCENAFDRNCGRFLRWPRCWR